MLSSYHQVIPTNSKNTSVLRNDTAEKIKLISSFLDKKL